MREAWNQGLAAVNPQMNQFVVLRQALQQASQPTPPAPAGVAGDKDIPSEQPIEPIPKVTERQKQCKQWMTYYIRTLKKITPACRKQLGLKLFTPTFNCKDKNFREAMRLVNQSGAKSLIEFAQLMTAKCEGEAGDVRPDLVDPVPAPPAPPPSLASYKVIFERMAAEFNTRGIGSLGKYPAARDVLAQTAKDWEAEFIKKPLQDHGKLNTAIPAFVSRVVENIKAIEEQTGMAQQRVTRKSK